MTDEELRAFVLAFCDGAVFTSLQAPPEMLRSVFMPLGLGALADWTEAELRRIGLVWEHLSKAGPLAVNDCPTFMSCRIMHVDDWRRARDAIERELERRRNIEV